MNKILPLLAIGGLIALTACEDDIIDTDGDTDGVDTVDCNPGDVFPATGPLSDGDYTGCNPYTGETLISYFPKPECSGSWTYDVELKGTAGAVKLTEYNFGDGADGQWGEVHDVADGAFEPNGWWDAWDADLAVVGSVAEQEANVSTINGCENNNGSSLIWAYEAFRDAEATDRIDCLVVVELESATDAFYDYEDNSRLEGCDEVVNWADE